MAAAEFFGPERPDFRERLAIVLYRVIKAKFLLDPGQSRLGQGAAYDQLVPDPAPVLATLDEPGRNQYRQMPRRTRSRNPEQFGYLACTQFRIITQSRDNPQPVTIGQSFEDWEEGVQINKWLFS